MNYLKKPERLGSAHSMEGHLAGMIDVAAAIIRRGDKILVVRRAVGQHLAGFWEFPGGKIEQGESPEVCLVRELREELSIEVDVGAFAGENIHQYPDKTIHLMAYYATIAAGEPVPTVHDRLMWLKPSALAQLPLSEADHPIAEAVRNTLPEFYDINAADYFCATHDLDPESFLAPLATVLSREARILDIGCGSGRDLAWLLRKEFRPTGFELSPTLAQLAREHSGCPVIEGDFFTFDFTALSFDAILMVGSLVHLQHNQLSSVLQRIAGALTSGGFIMLTLKEGDGAGVQSDGRVFTLWRPLTLEQIFIDLGFEIVDSNRQVSRLRQSDVWLGYLLRFNIHRRVQDRRH
ncbi:MAG: NUDIX domain-containing protein [Desulfobulbaceae bacterium]|nr:NUDIX domain-containing protein [Desulfobulbaceae bacterium]